MKPKFSSNVMSAKHLGLLALSVSMAGCGAQSDPTSDYKDLGANVPAYQETQKAQGVLAAGLFSADIPSNMNFVEGVEASYPITVSTKLRDISFALTATGLPTGLSLMRIDATHYVLKGTVPVGSSTGLRTGEKVPVTLAAENVKGEQTEVQMFNSLLHTWTPTIAVFPTDQMPMVESQKLGLSAQEGGEALPFSIIVNDAGSHDSQAPQIQSPFQDDIQSGEVAFVSAMPGVRISRTPVTLGRGKFKFVGTLDPKRLSIPGGKKDVTARLVVNFKSPSGLISADEIIDVKIIRAPPAPVPAPQKAKAAPTNKVSSLKKTGTAPSTDSSQQVAPVKAADGAGVVAIKPATAAGDAK